MVRRYKVLKGRWKGLIVTKKELSDKQADNDHPPISIGFVCVYDNGSGEYLGWCGSHWFKKNTSPWLNG